MNVLVAMDSFKGGISAKEASRWVAAGITDAGGVARCMPIADGGEGTVATMLSARAGEWVEMEMEVAGPLPGMNVRAGLTRCGMLNYDPGTVVNAVQSRAAYSVVEFCATVPIKCVGLIEWINCQPGGVDDERGKPHRLLSIIRICMGIQYRGNQHCAP